MESKDLKHETELVIPKQTDTLAFGTAQNPALIFIEPRGRRRSESAVHLEKSRFSVITAHDARDIYLMSGSMHFPCAVLSDEIGPIALQASTEAVRWQWPRTRILILGSPGELEDHLYDDCIPRTSGAEALVTKLESLADSAAQRRFDNRT